MGLLDDLKQQVESQRQQEQSDQADKSRGVKAMHAKLHEVARYFTELANSLNLIKQQVVRSFYIEGTNTLDDLRQCDYAVRERRKTIEHEDYLEEVSLRYRCLGERNLVIEKESQLVQRTESLLWSYNLRFENREVRNDRGLIERAVFTITKDVPAAVAFISDADPGKIKLIIKNVERLGGLHYEYDASEVNGELLEEIAKLVLGKPNNLRQIGKYQEMVRSTPRLTPAMTETPDPPPSQQQMSPAPEPQGGLVDNLKSLLKR